MSLELLRLLIIAAAILGLAGFLIMRSTTGTDPHADSRAKMMREQIERRGITDARLLEVIGRIRRHLFLPPAFRTAAYRDGAVSIGKGQTISQPYIVAIMTELLKLKGAERILEIGTGSGYQTAVLAELSAAVFTVEIVPELAHTARALLKDLGYKNIHFKTGDGYQGWKSHAPYDAVIVTAAPDAVPGELIRQLKNGGRLVIPVGESHQSLRVIVKNGEEVDSRDIAPVKFVPMVHERKSF